jgi:perosamine synthetase
VLRRDSAGGPWPQVSAWPPLPPGAWLRPPASPLPFPLEEPGYRLYAFARHALWHGVRALGLGPGDEVLMPAYNHGSEVEALLRAGVEPRFYAGRADLSPDEAELGSLAGPRTRALYIIDYLGFPQDGARWRRWCDAHGLLLIEDAAQAWLATHGGFPAGAHADLAVYCLYKTFGLTEGAALVSRLPPPPLRHDPGTGLTDAARRHLLWAVQRSGALSELARRRPRRRRVEGGDDPFELYPTFDSLPWSSVAFLVPRLAADDAAAARRANYRIMLAELRDSVPEPFGDLPDGASPFVLPVRTAAKPALLERLRAHGIKAMDVWADTHAAIPGAFPQVGARRATTVGLPVHQELRLTELDRILGVVTRRPARPRPLRVEPVADLAELRGDWDELAARADNPFATWEWISTWWRHFGAGRPLRTLACREPDGRLVAIVPAFESTRRPLRTLRFIGHDLGDRLGPICDPADAGRTARALAGALRRGHLGADLLLGEQLPGDGAWGTLLGASLVRRESSPVLDLDGAGFDAWLATRSRNFREQVRRRERRLRDEGLRYRLCRSADTLEADLDTLFGLHAARWGERDEAFLPRLLPFHREFAALALARGWLRLWILELAGRPAAAWEGYRFGGADWYYQAGREPALDRHAVGFVLLAHTVRDAMEAGMRRYCLGRGDEGYKRRFASRDPGLVKVVLGRGPAGAAAQAAAAAAPALPSRARRRLAGIAA